MRDLNVHDDIGPSALFRFIKDPKRLEKLLKVPGLDVNARGYKKSTALIAAISELKLAIYELRKKSIKTKGEKTDLSNQIKSIKESINLLLNQPGVDLNAQDSYGYSALAWAIRKNLNDTAFILIKKKGIELNQYSDMSSETMREFLDYGGLTPLMIAVYAGRLKIVRALLDAGADRDLLSMSVRIKPEKTALQFAQEQQTKGKEGSVWWKQYQKIIKVLKEYMQPKGS